MYLTYQEYTSRGGTLDNTTFTDLEYEARTYIDWVTFNRLHDEAEIPEEVKDCIYHILKLIQNKLELLNTPITDSVSSSNIQSIASQSNDGVSISYNTLSAKDLIDLSEKELTKTINRYLGNVRNSLGHRLLYRGIYPDEVVND